MSSGLRARSAILALAVGLGLIASGAPAGARQQPDSRPPVLDAHAWVLVDARDGTRLAGRATGRPLPIASTTKLMTAYLTLRELPLDRMLRAPGYAAAPAESVLGLGAGERISVRDLLTAMLLPSANDAAVALATGAAGSVPRFVRRMNGAAARLDLDDTSYANPIGLDDPDNHSTAADLASLALTLREDPTFRRIVAMPEAVLDSGPVRRTVTTRNTLLRSDPSVDGVKTGHTMGAGYVLVASARRDGVPLLSVVLGASSEAARDAESERLLDFGYDLYDRRQALARGEQFADAVVRYEDETLPLVAKRRIAVQARADQELETAVQAPVEVEGPIRKGERLGRVEVTLDGKRVGAAPLVASRAVAEAGLVARIGGPAVALLIIAGFFVIVIGGFAVLRRRRRSHGGRRTPEERMQSRQQRSSRRTGEGGGG